MALAPGGWTGAASLRSSNSGLRAWESDPIAGGPGRKTRARRARTWDQGARAWGLGPRRSKPDQDARTWDRVAVKPATDAQAWWPGCAGPGTRMRGLRTSDYGLRTAANWPGCADLVATDARTSDQGARTSAPVDYSPDHDTRTFPTRPRRLVRLSYASGRGPGLIALFFPRQ